MAGQEPGSSTFGALLRQHRVAAALSQEALAEQSGLSARAISDLERGVKTRPYLETVRRLAEAMDLSDVARAGLIAAARPIPAASESAHFTPSMFDAPGSLPSAALSSLLGREEEIVNLTGMLAREDVRLVTLTGPGGVGKTRLGIAAAREMLGWFPGDVRLVDLSPIREPSFVLGAVALSLGIRDGADGPLLDRVCRAMQGRRALLLIDNFEHVLSAALDIAHLLRCVEGLKVIATSRIPLHLTSEQEVLVEPLATPQEDAQELRHSPAVALFIQRAQAVRPGFDVTPDNAQAIAAICRRLDGLPLAIELAAVRNKVLSPRQLLARLDRCLPVLTSGQSDLPARQATLRTTIEWSYDLLTEQEQVLFRRLSVFQGGCRLEAAEAVCDLDGSLDVFTALASLVDKNLLRRVGDEPRYQMLETIREYALERLDFSGEEPELRERHLAYYLLFTEQTDQIPPSPAKDEAGRAIDEDLPNLRAALAWAADQADAERLMRLVIALWWYWDWAGRGLLIEACYWTDRAVSISANVPKAFRALRARTLALGARGRMSRGITESVEVLLAEAQALAEETGDPNAAVDTLFGQGQLAIVRDELDRAEPIITKAVSRARSAGEAGQVIILLNWLTWLHSLRGDLDAAESASLEFLEAARASGWKAQTGLALETLGSCARERGAFRRAASLFAEALTYLRDGNVPSGFCLTLKSIGAVAAAAGRAEEATRLLGASDALYERVGFIEPATERDRIEQAVAPARSALSGEVFASAWAAGRALPLEQAIAEALAVAEEIATARPAEAETPAGLTPREVEVLGLLVDGLSDREIAERLFVSRHTAANHVGSILSKLGLPSRAAAAAWAVRNGIA